MTVLVDPNEIEAKVEHERDPERHLGRWRTDEGAFYILHSQACRDSGIDLRECVFSEALDNSARYDPDWPLLIPPDRTVILGTEWFLARRLLICRRVVGD